MRNRFIFFGIVFLSFQFLNAQAIQGKSYYTLVNNVEVTNPKAAEKSFKLTKGAIFSVDDIDEKNNKVIVTIWRFNGTDENVKTYISNLALSKEFSKTSIPIDIFKKQTSELTEKDMEIKYNTGMQYVGYWSNGLQFHMSLAEFNDMVN